MFILDNLSNVISRLFPFKRGLCHAYWAPNLWAVYNVADKALVLVARKTGLLKTGESSVSMTAGLVQDIEHQVLPNISPLTTMILTMTLMIPALIKLWRSPGNTTQFIRCLALCGWSSFLCGWHVHEKAVLLISLPMTLLGTTNKQDTRYFTLLSTVGHLSLFPLLFTSQELPSKLLLFISYTLLLHLTTSPSYNILESLYLSLGIPVVIYCEFIKSVSLPFLPLIIYSLYCAVGVIYCYIRVYTGYLLS